MRVLRQDACSYLVASAVLFASAKLSAITLQTDVTTAMTAASSGWRIRRLHQPSNVGDAATGLAALLEKRASGIPADPPQGYNGASVTDQARPATWPPTSWTASTRPPSAPTGTAASSGWPVMH